MSVSDFEKKEQKSPPFDIEETLVINVKGLEEFINNYPRRLCSVHKDSDYQSLEIAEKILKGEIC